MKIYVASSWRNQKQQDVVIALRNQGHEVYDFKHPEKGNDGFHWSEIDHNWKNWTPKQYIQNLTHPIAVDGYKKDLHAMMWANACVLVMPCGRSAHLEAGYFVGHNEKLIILIDDGEPELMYKMADKICITLGEVCEALKE